MSLSDSARIRASCRRVTTWPSTSTSTNVLVGFVAARRAEKAASISAWVASPRSITRRPKSESDALPLRDPPLSAFGFALAPEAELGPDESLAAGVPLDFGSVSLTEVSVPAGSGHCTVTILLFAIRMQTVPRRILIVRPSALGDVCRTIPLLWSLRAAYPHATIDWVVEDTWSAAIAAHPALDEAVAFPKRKLRKFWRNPRVAWQAARWFFSLRQRRYDLVIDAQGLARSGLMSLMSGAPLRVAHRSAREFSWLAANLRVESAPGEHVVDAMLRLVEAAGAIPMAKMHLALAEADALWWTEQRRAREIARPYVVLATANRWEGKRWITSRWRELVVAVSEDLAMAGMHDIVWIGGPDESAQVAQNALAQELLTTHRSHDLSGATTVGGMMAIIKDAALVVSLDSAPAHLAVGFGVPLVALYGSTSIATDGPYEQDRWCAHGGRNEQVRRHDYRKVTRGRELMERISVADVATLIRKRLKFEVPS